MNVRQPALLPASAVVFVVAIFPYATIWIPFQAGLWVSGGALAAIVAVLIALGRRDFVLAVRGLPRSVRLGLMLYGSAAAYGAVLGVALGNPIRYVASQAASMAILPASLVAFSTGTRLNVRRLATGLALGGAVALAVHAGSLVAHVGGPAVAGEALRLVLPNDVSFTGAAVMTFLVALAWWGEERTALAAGAVAVSGCLLVGGMSRGAWLASLGGTLVFWWLSRRRRWWTSALLAGVPLACIAAVLGASSWVLARERPLATKRVEVAAKTPLEDQIDIARGVHVSGRPVEIAFSARGFSPPPPVLAVEGRDATGGVTRLANLTANPEASSESVRAVLFLPANVARLDFWVRRWGEGGHSVGLEARELPGAPAAWVRALGLRLGTTGTALTKPVADGTMQYRLAEWSAVRQAWRNASPLRVLTGQGLGATVEFPNSSWDEQGRRIVAPTASYLHDFYVFLGFKLGVAGIGALAGLLMIAGWTLRGALSARSSGGSLSLAAAAACWCAYLVWDVTSPEIISAHTATLLGALLAASLADAGRPRPAPPHAASLSQSSSISNA